MKKKPKIIGIKEEIIKYAAIVIQDFKSLFYQLMLMLFKSSIKILKTNIKKNKI